MLNLFNRVHEKLTVSEFVKKFPAYLESKYYVLNTKKKQASGCYAEQMNPGETLIYCFIMIHFNNIFINF